MGGDSHAKGGHDHGGKGHGDHGHGHGHGDGHGHGHGHDHHYVQPVENSVIKYEIPDAAHHTEEFQAPDWRLFKVENAPELLSVQQRLAARGLKDPWLRFDPLLLKL
jgi:hypothetical protein